MTSCELIDKSFLVEKDFCSPLWRSGFEQSIQEQVGILCIGYSQLNGLVLHIQNLVLASRLLVYRRDLNIRQPNESHVYLLMARNKRERNLQKPTSLSFFFHQRSLCEGKSSGILPVVPTIASLIAINNSQNLIPQSSSVRNLVSEELPLSSSSPSWYCSHSRFSVAELVIA